MKTADYELMPASDLVQLGMIVLQSDVTIEDEFRFYFADKKVSLLVNRIPFENEVTAETLADMAHHLKVTLLDRTPFTFSRRLVLLVLPFAVALDATKQSFGSFAV